MSYSVGRNSPPNSPLRHNGNALVRRPKVIDLFDVPRQNFLFPMYSLRLAIGQDLKAALLP